jgi:hypothetical protein
MVDEVVLEQIYPLNFYRFYLPLIILSLFHFYLSWSLEVCGGPDQAANYCTVSSPTQHKVGILNIFMNITVLAFAKK